MSLSLPTEGIYVRANAKGVRYWQLERDGANLITATGTSLQKLKSKTQTLADEHEARRSAIKTRHKKMREGYVFLRPFVEAGVGEVFFRCSLPHSQQHDYLDVSPSGRYLLIASEQRPMNHNAWLHLVDQETATTTELFHDDGSWTSSSQTFTHRAQFLGEDAALFAVNGRTWRVEIPTGKASVVSSFQDNSYNARFNDHRVWPSRDAHYKRALVFEQGDVLRVIEASGQAIFELSLSSETLECLAASLSPSGRYVVGYLANTDLLYQEESTMSAQTHEVRVWDVESGKQVSCFSPDYPLSRVGLTPDDRQVIAVRDYAQGPVFFDAESGKQIRFFDDPYSDDRWQTCPGWSYSADGTLLALATDPLQLLDAKEFQVLRQLQDPESFDMSVRSLTFSSDNRSLYLGTTFGEIVGWRLR